MRASQPHRRATAPEQIEAALDARGEPEFTSGLFTLLKPLWPTSSCERNVVRPTPT